MSQQVLQGRLRACLCIQLNQNLCPLLDIIAPAADVPEVGGIAPTLALFVKTFDDDEDPEYVTICLCAVVDM